MFFFKQKTAYEMFGRDWSSDVCSSDLTEKWSDVPDPSDTVKLWVSHNSTFMILSVINPSKIGRASCRERV